MSRATVSSGLAMGAFTPEPSHWPFSGFKRHASRVLKETHLRDFSDTEH